MKKEIGFLGGTGDLGPALAVNIHEGFDRILIGSRSMEKAVKAVDEINSEKKNPDLERKLVPATNEQVVEECENIVLTVPYASAVETVRVLSSKFRTGQLLISAAAPVRKIGNEFFSAEPGSNSITKSLVDLLPGGVEIATAFQTIPARVFYSGRLAEADVLVCSSEQTFRKVAEIVTKIKPLRALHVGSLELSGEVERLTAMLLNISIRNHLKSPTIKILSF